MTDRLAPFRRSFLKASTFAERAYDAMEVLHQEPIQTDRAEGVKELVEEVLPLACFLGFINCQQQRVRCKYFGGEHPFDAKLRIEGELVRQGWQESSYYVEVTSAVSPREYLEREALARYGHVYAGRGVKRIGSARKGTAGVESRLQVRRSDDAQDDMTSWVVKAVESKLEKEYPTGTLLVVRAEAEGGLSSREWYEVAIAAARDLPSETSFVGIFLVQTSEGHVLSLT